MLYYDDPTHKYWWEDENGKIPLTSATQKISKAKKPFNSHMIAGSVARKSGRNQKEIVAEWSLKGDISCDWGNAIHKSVELWVKYSAIPKTKYLQDVVEEFKKLGYENLQAEKLVYNLDIGVAGRMDLIDGDLENMKVNIRDIKTSAGITDKKKSFHGILKDKICSKLDEYTLQLSLYAYMLEQKGYEIGTLTILEWKEGEFTEMHVPYRPDWVKLLIEQY